MIKGQGFSAADASVPLADEVARLPFEQSGGMLVGSPEFDSSARKVLIL